MVKKLRGAGPARPAHSLVAQRVTVTDLVSERPSALSVK